MKKLTIVSFIAFSIISNSIKASIDTIPMMQQFFTQSPDWVNRGVVDSSMIADSSSHSWVYAAVDSTTTNYVNDTTPYTTVGHRHRICQNPTCFLRQRQRYSNGKAIVSELFDYESTIKKRKKIRKD